MKTDSMRTLVQFNDGEGYIKEMRDFISQELSRERKKVVEEIREIIEKNKYTALDNKKPMGKEFVAWNTGLDDILSELATLQEDKDEYAK